MKFAEKKIRTNLRENITYFNNVLNVNKNFDLVYRVIKFGEKEACFYFVDGFLKDEMLQKMLQYFNSIKKEEMPGSAHEMSKLFMPYGEVDLLSDWEEILKNLLSGVTIMFLDGYSECIAIDCRTYPMRSISEPEKDKVLRGSKDGFVETLVFNTALIRRRIRTPELTMEIKIVGESSKTDIVVCYMEDRVDKKFLEEVLKRIDSIKVDALTLNQESLAECLYQYKWYNPFPKFKFSERPDTAAAQVLEGNIVILVDNSPSCIILPNTVFDIIEEADDYYFPPITGTYLRLTRYAIAVVTLLLTPLWLLFVKNPEWLPSWLQFTVITDEIHVPIFLQLILLEFAIDGLKLAAVNTPSMLSTPLSVITALVLGEFSVKSGWFNSEAMLYMAFVAVANYTQQSYELGYALKFMRMILLVLTQLFDLYGFIGGIILTIVLLASNKTISGSGYFYPVIPFNLKEFCKRMIRRRLKYEDI
ncbi:MAG: spore germination protein [Lachnospiraceae bacterium]|nr:spore germination protein [Lachnospiraceae bacterium]